MPAFFLRLLLLSFFSAVFPAHSTLVQFTFSGEITEVLNDEHTYWEPSELVGEVVTGQVTLDTELVTHGDLNTSYSWYSTTDKAPGALSSQIDFAGLSYTLSTEFDMDYSFTEYIGVSDGPRETGDGLVGDGLVFWDEQNRFDVEQDDGSLANEYTELRVGFREYVNDILHFDEGLQENIAPDFVQEFDWYWDDPDDTDRTGGGSFSYRQISDGEYFYDSILGFRLTQLSGRELNTEPPGEIPAPPSLLLALLAVVLLKAMHIRHRQTQQPG